MNVACNCFPDSEGIHALACATRSGSCKAEYRGTATSNGQPFPIPPCVPAPFAPATIPQRIFDNFGGNWRWASIDYRGVARVHTFEPTFTASGRIEVPRGKHNSQPCEAFDMVDAPPSPVWVTRNAWPRGKVTDRFGIDLPTGADPVEAADVIGSCAPVPMPPPKRGGRKPAKAPFDWVQWIDAKRVAITPEYEGGFHAEAYLSDGEPQHSAYGDTARDALNNLADLMGIDHSD